MRKELLLALGEFLGLESINPLVERREVVRVGVDGLELLFSSPLAEEEECSLSVWERVCLLDRGGVSDDGGGIRWRGFGSRSGGLLWCFGRRVEGGFRLKLPVSGSFWCGGVCSGRYCNGTRRRVGCSGCNLA